MAPISGRACITIVWSGVSELGFRLPSTTWPRSLTTTTSAAVTVGYGMPLGEMAMRLVSGSRMLMLPAVPWTTPRANASNPTWTTCSRRCSSNIPHSTPCLFGTTGSRKLAADDVARIDGSQDGELLSRWRRCNWRLRSDGDGKPGGVLERFPRDARMQTFDLEPTVVTREDAERCNHPVDISSGSDEIESFDKCPRIMLGAPEDDAARSRHQHCAPGTAGESHRWMLI